MATLALPPPPAPTAGPSRPSASSRPRPNVNARGPDTWHPSRYLEPNHPDNEEVVEQAAYQAAVTKHGGDNRKSRYKPRKTVDYQGGVLKWRQMVKMRGTARTAGGGGGEREWGSMMHPNASDLIGLLPPAAHPLNPSTSILDQFIHTSINKERSSTRVVAWTPDCRRLLTGNDKGQFTLWNGSSFNYESITQVHDDSLRAMAWSHNGQALISADKLGVIKYFTPHLTNVNQLQGHREACHSISWSPNDERFVSGGDDGLVKVWSYREAKEEKALSGHGWDVRCVDWHPTKGLIASGSRDMLVKFWDPRTGKELSTLHTHKSTINTCKWSPSGHLLSTAGGDGNIKLFDIRTFRELDVLKGHTKEINTLTWHPIHPQIFCSGDAAGAILHWSLTSPDPSVPVTTLSAAHDDAVFSLSYHPMGHILCSGSKDFSARFWCRPRPMGGHERDRWHLGDERAMGAKMEAATMDGPPGGRWKMGPLSGQAQGQGQDEREGRDTKPGLPGLPGLAGLPGLPGLSAPMGIKAEPPSSNPGASGRYVDGPGAAVVGGMAAPGLPGLGNASATGQRQWGQAQDDIASGYGRSAPLPSQADMLRNNASNSAPSRYGGRDRDIGRDWDAGRDMGRDRDGARGGGRYDAGGGQNRYGPPEGGQGGYGGDAPGQGWGRGGDPYGQRVGAAPGQHQQTGRGYGPPGSGGGGYGGYPPPQGYSGGGGYR